MSHSPVKNTRNYQLEVLSVTRETQKKILVSVLIQQLTSQHIREGNARVIASKYVKCNHGALKRWQPLNLQTINIINIHSESISYLGC